MAVYFSPNNFEFENPLAVYGEKKYRRAFRSKRAPTEEKESTLGAAITTTTVLTGSTLTGKSIAIQG